ANLHRTSLRRRHHRRPWLAAGNAHRGPHVRRHRGHDGDLSWPLLVASGCFRIVARLSGATAARPARSSGVTDSGTVRFWVRAIALAAVSLVTVALMLRSARNDYAFYLAYLIFQYVALALGWNILGGYAGFVNFGASAFFAAGAYSTVALNKTIAAPLP